MSDNTVEGLMALADAYAAQVAGAQLDSEVDDARAKFRTALESLTAAQAPASPPGVVSEKRAPVQGYTPGIPWSMHLEAYDAYRKRWGAQPALIDLEGRNCRGGFGIGELDEFIPGWRDKLSEITALRARIKELEAASPSTPVAAKPLRLLTVAERELIARRIIPGIDLISHTTAIRMLQDCERTVFEVNALPLPGADGDGTDKGGV